MKTSKQSRWALITLLAWLAAAPAAHAFYNQSTGRWLSRDPLGEIGFERTRQNALRSVVLQGDIACYIFNENAPLNRFDGLGLDSNIATGTTFTTDLQGGGQVTVTVGSHFTDGEKQLAIRALCLVKKLLGGPTYVPYFPDTYWATFSGKTDVDGLTHDGSIFISASRKPNRDCSLSAVMEFGKTLAHEADHFYTGSNDGPGGPEYRIDAVLNANFAKALSQAVCGCCNGEWRLKNLLGKYACECGLKPCKPEACPTPQ